MKVMTFGWSVSYIEKFAVHIEDGASFKFHYCFCDRDVSAEKYSKRLGSSEFTVLDAMRKSKSSVDFDLLSDIERAAGKSIRNMVFGDRHLRVKGSDFSIAYVYNLAVEMIDAIRSGQPSIILATNDNIDSSLSEAVARYLNVPWFSLAFTAIPQSYTTFKNRLKPEARVDFERTLSSDELSALMDIVSRWELGEAEKGDMHNPGASLASFSYRQLRRVGSVMKRYGANYVPDIDPILLPSIPSQAVRSFRRLINRMRLMGLGLITQPPKEKFVLYMLHMRPESTIDVWQPEYEDQLAFIKQVSLFIPLNYTLVVKMHASDIDSYSLNDLKAIKNIPNVQVCDPLADGRSFIKRTSLLLGINGTALLEAALLGKPALAFGQTPYDKWPTTMRFNGFGSLYTDILKAVALPKPSIETRIDIYRSYLSKYYPGKLNNWSVPMSPTEKANLAVLFEQLVLQVERVSGLSLPKAGSE